MEIKLARLLPEAVYTIAYACGCSRPEDTLKPQRKVAHFLSGSTPSTELTDGRYQREFVLLKFGQMGVKARYYKYVSWRTGCGYIFETKLPAA